MGYKGEKQVGTEFQPAFLGGVRGMLFLDVFYYLKKSGCNKPFIVFYFGLLCASLLWNDISLAIGRSHPKVGFRV